MDIADVVKVHPSTVARVLYGWYQIIQEELSKVDMQIDGLSADGAPIVVEIDESKFGKRKYNRGGSAEGVWVVGGAKKKTPERKCFFVTVNDRSKETLNRIITTYVKPNSVVRTDGWAGYRDISLLHDGTLTHEVVNHSVEFVTTAEVHTNTIEGTWYGIKQNVIYCHRNKKMTPWLLLEFIWRTKNRRDLWGAVITGLGAVSFTSGRFNSAYYIQFGYIDDEGQEE
ncbi:hypothetical protein RMCBS344292_14123 [Rhizopus microsporus]|nr:hypothetical protein RMCBS344292_14123 [Rhizopus microsporus]